MLTFASCFLEVHLPRIHLCILFFGFVFSEQGKRRQKSGNGNVAWSGGRIHKVVTMAGCWGLSSEIKGYQSSFCFKVALHRYIILSFTPAFFVQYGLHFLSSYGRTVFHYFLEVHFPNWWGSRSATQGCPIPSLHILQSHIFPEHFYGREKVAIDLFWRNFFLERIPIKGASILWTYFQ